MASSVNFLVHLSPSHGHASNNSHATAKDDQTGEKFSWMWRGTIEDGFWHPMDVQDVQTSCTVWQVRWEMFLSVMCQERMKNMRVHLPYRPFSKLYLDHLSRASGIPGGIAIANPVTRISLMWTSKMALGWLSSTKVFKQHAWQIYPGEDLLDLVTKWWNK